MNRKLIRTCQIGPMTVNLYEERGTAPAATAANQLLALRVLTIVALLEEAQGRHPADPAIAGALDLARELSRAGDGRTA